MTIYYFLLLVLILLLVLAPKRNKNALRFSCAFLFVLSAFRGESVGTDTINYINIFNTITTKGHYKVFELFWYYLSFSISELGLSVRYVFVISSSLIILCIYKGIAKASRYYVFSIILFLLFYYFFESLNIVRQYIAMSIIFLAVSFFEDTSKVKSWISYYVLSIAALLCHTSALIAFAMPLICYLPINRINATIAIVLSLIIGSIPLHHYLLQVDILFLSDTYNHYLENYNIAGVTGTRILVSLFICYIIQSQPNSFDRFDKLMICGICLQNAFPYPVVIRMFSYLIIFSIISIPNRYVQNRKLLFLIVTLLYGMIKMSVFLNANVSDVVPYTFG